MSQVCIINSRPQVEMIADRILVIGGRKIEHPKLIKFSDTFAAGITGSADFDGFVRAWASGPSASLISWVERYAQLVLPLGRALVLKDGVAFGISSEGGYEIDLSTNAGVIVACEGYYSEHLIGKSREELFASLRDRSDIYTSVEGGYDSFLMTPEEKTIGKH